MLSHTYIAEGLGMYISTLKMVISYSNTTNCLELNSQASKSWGRGREGNNRTSTLGMVPAKMACPSISYSRMCQKR